MTTKDKIRELRKNLNPIQHMAFEALKWLLNPRGDFRQGRTYAIALAILLTAVKNPGIPIYLFDHRLEPKQFAEEILLPLIDDVLDAKSDFVFNQTYVVYDPDESKVQ